MFAPEVSHVDAGSPAVAEAGRHPPVSSVTVGAASAAAQNGPRPTIVTATPAGAIALGHRRPIGKSLALVHVRARGSRLSS